MMLAMSAMALWSGTEMAAQISVVELYQEGASLDEKAATELRCNVQRSCAIVAMQGKMSPELTQLNHFIVLVCDQSVMAESERRLTMAILSAGREPVANFEG